MYPTWLLLAETTSASPVLKTPTSPNVLLPCLFFSFRLLVSRRELSFSISLSPVLKLLPAQMFLSLFTFLFLVFLFRRTHDTAVDCSRRRWCGVVLSQVQARGELKEAEAMFTRALDIGRQMYGPSHPNVATGLSNLAGLLRCQGMCGAFIRPSCWKKYST